MKQFITHGLQGIAMGLAQVIPGVSGSTIALIMGIYTRFLDVLYGVSQVVKHILYAFVGKDNWSTVKKEFLNIRWGFALSLFGGMAIGIIGLASVLEGALEAYPQYVYAFFFGLVLSSALIPWKLVQHPGFKHAAILFGSTIGWLIFFSLVPSQELQNVPLWYLFLGGFVGILGLILPAVSGSFILLIMGQYGYVIGLVNDLLSFQTSALVPIIVFGSGLVVGFLVCVRVLKKVLQTAEGILMAFLSGVMIASLQVMWPFFQLNGELREWVPIGSFSTIDLIWIGGLIFAGFIAVKWLQSTSPRI